jgi:hypothetical protein
VSEQSVYGTERESGADELARSDLWEHKLLALMESYCSHSGGDKERLEASVWLGA